MQSKLAAILQEGIEDGSRRDVPPRLTTLTLMSDDEAVQHWFRHDTGPLRDPAAIGTALARLAVGGLLTDPTELGDVAGTAGPPTS